MRGWLSIGRANPDSSFCRPINLSIASYIISVTWDIGMAFEMRIHTPLYRIGMESDDPRKARLLAGGHGCAARTPLPDVQL